MKLYILYISLYLKDIEVVCNNGTESSDLLHYYYFFILLNTVFFIFSLLKTLYFHTYILYLSQQKSILKLSLCNIIPTSGFAFIHNSQFFPQSRE